MISGLSLSTRSSMWCKVGSADLYPVIVLAIGFEHVHGHDLKSVLLVYSRGSYEFKEVLHTTLHVADSCIAGP
jgi:hypothetical protein